MAAPDIPAAGPTDAAILLRNSSALMARHLGLWALNAVLVLFVPRYLGDSGMGQLQFALSLVSLFAVGVDLGMRQLLIKEVARDHGQLRALLGAALALYLVSSALVLGAIAVTANLAIAYPGLRAVVYVTALWMVASSLSHLLRALLHGLENMVWPALAETANKVVVVVAGITVLVLGLGVMAYAAVLALGAVAELALNAAYLGKRVPFPRLDLRPARVRRLLAGGAPFLLIGFILQAYGHVDVVMLRLLTHDAVVGWYAVATQVYRTIEFVPLALATALLPTLARVHRTNGEAMARMAAKALAASVVLIVPLALAVSLLADEVIRVLPYPAGFRNAVPLLAIVMLSAPVTTLLMVLGAIVIARDHQKAWSAALAATLALNIALNAVAIPYCQRAYANGAIGAAAATVVCEAFMVGVGLALMPSGGVGKAASLALARAALCGAAMAAIGLSARALDAWPVPYVAAGLAAYIALALATRAVTLADLRSLHDAAAVRLGIRHP